MDAAVLSRSDVEQLLDIRDVIREVRDVYRLKAEGKTAVWPLVSWDFKEERGVMDIRSGCIMEKQLHGMKMLNNFPSNQEKGLPPFNGVLLIFDSNTGLPLGVMDASYITCMRTGAAGALGAAWLARGDAKNLMLLGAGKQSAYQIAAALALMPWIEKVRVADPLSAENARDFAANIRERLKTEFSLDVGENVSFEAAEDLPQAVNDSDIIITITPARKPVIQKEWVKPGTHFSCIGADMEGKEEIDPELFRSAVIFADDKEQCMRVGEMELPLKRGVITSLDVRGELGELIAGKAVGRSSNQEITIFDATGLAMLDLVTGKIAIDKALERKIGLHVAFA